MKSVLHICVELYLYRIYVVAHAIHPNYAAKHEENHCPQMHKGTVIKVNANQRYATTAVTSLVLKELAKKHKIPIQVCFVRTILLNFQKTKMY